MEEYRICMLAYPRIVELGLYTNILSLLLILGSEDLQLVCLERARLHYQCDDTVWQDDERPTCPHLQHLGDDLTC